MQKNSHENDTKAILMGISYFILNETDENAYIFSPKTVALRDIFTARFSFF